MVVNIITKTINLALCDIVRLRKYKNRSDVVRKALEIFVEREKRTDKDTTQKSITKTGISIGIEKETLEYLDSIYRDTKTNSKRYFTFSEIMRVALRDFWEIIDNPIQEERVEPEEILEISEPDTRDYLERNGIKILRTA